MTNLKVLMFGWELPPHNSGGLGVACYGLTKGLSGRGARIAFAMPRRMPQSVAFMDVLDHELQVTSVTALNSLMTSYMNKSKYDQSVLGGGEGMQMYGRTLYEEAIRFGDMAVSWSRAQPHEIIHTHDWMTYPAGIQAKKVSGKPMVAHVHATEFDRTGGNVDSAVSEIEYQGLSLADRVIAVSNYTKGVINKHYSIPNEKIHVVHNGVDMSEFSPKKVRQIFPNDKIVLYVGRLTLQKGVDYLLAAAARVLAQQPRTIFLVVGSGDMERKLIMQAAAAGVGQRVIFAGFMSGEKLKDCYQMADVFVMPSVSEPYGIVALEAIAAGVPVVISKQSGVAESVANVQTVDFWDVDRMGDLIVEILENPEQSNKAAMRAKREAAKMTWERAAYKTLQVYKDLLS